MNADKELISIKKAMSISIPDLNGTTECIVARSDKIILSTHAIFEGIGIAGLISAAFSYTTAPMAPDGFKGPISVLSQKIRDNVKIVAIKSTGGNHMISFKWRHFKKDMILILVR